MKIATAKSLVVKHLRTNSGELYRTAPHGSGKLFVEDVVARKIALTSQQQPVFMRQINPESRQWILRNHGASLWILGLKTEGYGTIVETTNGGRTEVLGGLVYPAWAPPPEHNQPGPHEPAFINDESDFCAFFATEAWKRHWNYMEPVRERRREHTRVLTLEASDAGGRGNGHTLPFYLGRRGADASAPSIAATANHNADRGDGSARSAIITVARRGGSVTQPLEVAYRLRGSATPAAHYARLPTRVTIPAGAESADIRIELTRGGVPTGDRQLFLMLEPTADYALASTVLSITVEKVTQPDDAGHVDEATN